MTRFAADVRKVKMHIACTGTTKLGKACEAMTNYVCYRCNRGICGRHLTTHKCPPPAGAQ